MKKPCCEKAETTRGAWSKQEDQKLIDYIRRHGQGCWNSLPKAAGLRRCGKSCRLRWRNYLRPDLKRGSFGEDEVDLIIRLHSLLGNRWSLIAGRLPGRTDNEVKNYWNTHIKKMLSNINYPHPKRSSRHQNLKRAGGTTNTSVPPLVHPDARKPNLIIASSSPPPSSPPPPPPRKPQVEVNFHGILYNQDDDDDDGEVVSGSVNTGNDDIIVEESGLPDLNLDLTL